MSLIQNSFLKVPLQDVLTVYHNEIVPRLTKKNKVISITVAVVLSLVYYITDKVMKPPKNVRHIPYLGYFGSIISTFSKENHWKRAYNTHLPEIESKNHNIFLEQGRWGWVVQVSNPKDAKRVFLKLDIFPKIKTNTKDLRTTLNTKFTGGPNLVTLNGDEWRAQRLLANPAFVRSVPVKLFGKLTEDVIREIEADGETTNISDLTGRWALDVIGKAGFDFDFNAVSDQTSEWVCRYKKINDGIRDVKFAFFPILDSKLLWLFPERAKLHVELDLFFDMLNSVISKKREAIKNGVHNAALEENERDILDLMIESEESGDGIMNDEELMSNLCAFFLAGHDTTASALSFAIHYLAENQDIQQRAREEVLRILGDEPKDVCPTIEQTKEMTYINQIIKETLRINCPVNRIIPREVSEDTELSGVFIPKGARVVVNMFDIQHSNKVWKDAHIFDPERFAEGGEASHVESMSWSPFGNGARQCIGMNFSLSEQRVFLSMLLHKFTWTTPENSIHRKGLQTGGVLVISPQDLDMNFKKRY